MSSGSFPNRVWIDGLQVHKTPTYVLAPGGWKLATPAPREAMVPFARRHGVANDTSFLGHAVAELQIGVLADDVVVLRQAEDTLKARLRPGRDIELEWEPYDGATIRQMVMRLGGEIETMRTKGILSIVATTLASSTSPLAFSDDLHTAEYDPTLAFGGFGLTFPLTFPLVFSSGTAEDPTLPITNVGNMPSPPLLVVTGPVLNPEITNVTTGETIATFLNLGQGAQAFIDVERRELRLGSATGTLRLDLIDEADTSWWELQPGVNEIRMSDTTMTSNTRLRVDWRDAWLPD